MFGELGFAGVNIMDDLTEMVDVAFGIEGIGGDFKGNPMLARHFLCKIVKAVVIESPISAQTSSMLRLRSGSIRKFTLTAFAILMRLLCNSIIFICNDKCKSCHCIMLRNYRRLHF